MDLHKVTVDKIVHDEVKSDYILSLKGDVYYIDDITDYLLPVKNKVHCFLANWGYCTKKDIEKAEHSNIAIIGLLDLPKIL
jgi:hypothetical protein